MVDGLDHISVRDFERLSNYIQAYSGIKMPITKKTMVEGRLRRRVRAVGAPNLAAYCRYLFQDNGLEVESVHLIDAVTTNKTEFFREPDHFRFLADSVVPEILASRPSGRPAVIKIWSAASSIGAEPYTLAMVMADLSENGHRFRTSIVATDICTKVLESAVAGIYPEEMVAPVPPDMRKRYLLRSRDPKRSLVRIRPELRSCVEFSHLNLMDATYPMDHDMDVIFCRNILIYFDKDTQHAVLSRLCSHLRMGGFLFLGHSESLAGFGLPLQSVATTAFRRIEG